MIHSEVAQITSDTISWTESVDDEGLPMVSILVAIFVSVLLVGIWLVRSSSQVEEEEEDYAREI